MEINWKIKSKIFSLIDYFKLNFFLYLFQKYITEIPLKSQINITHYGNYIKKVLKLIKLMGLYLNLVQESP